MSAILIEPKMCWIDILWMLKCTLTHVSKLATSHPWLLWSQSDCVCVCRTLIIHHIKSAWGILKWSLSPAWCFMLDDCQVIQFDDGCNQYLFIWIKAASQVLGLHFVLFCVVCRFLYIFLVLHCPLREIGVGIPGNHISCKSSATIHVSVCGISVSLSKLSFSELCCLTCVCVCEHVCMRTYVCVCVCVC